MRLLGWRVASPRYSRTVAEMMSGEGSYLYGGRWNSKGTRVVYLGGSLSLAAFELLVHLQRPQVLMSYKNLLVSFKESHVLSVDKGDLPSDWNKLSVNSPVQYVGDDWVQQSASLILEVPSAVILGEKNYLVNVSHPDYPTLEFGEIEDFRFDPRVLK